MGKMCQNKKEEWGEADVLPSQTATHVTLSEAVERKNFFDMDYSGPSERVRWEFSVPRYLFQGFLTLTQTTCTSPHL